MARTIATADVEAEVRGLDALGTAALRQRWQALSGTEPAPGLKGELLRAVLAHRLQEQAFGGLRKDRAAQLAAMSEEPPGTRPASDATADHGAGRGERHRAPRRLRPGSRLLREWQGRMHEVVVTPEGYLWSGETHRSLSTIATRITGTSWNGWRFFGVASRAAGAKRETAAHG